MLNLAKLGRISWFWNRLRCMPPGEPAYRLWQSSLFLLERYGLMALSGPAAELPPPSGEGEQIFDVEPAPYVVEADAIAVGRVMLFADSMFDVGVLPEWNRDPLTGVLAPSTFGPALAITDRSLVGDIKHIWELNRHLHLVRLAQAYRLTGNSFYAEILAEQLRSWLDQCPILRGPNWSSSLELGIRLINWSLIWRLMGGSSGALFNGSQGIKLRSDWLASIYAHCQYIARHCSRHSSANNHLIGELSGLYVASRCWPFWPKTLNWAKRARSELEVQAALQHTVDGVNREQAYSYQVFTSEFLLIAGLAGQSSADPFSLAYWEKLQRALQFTAEARNVAGQAPMYGDADDGIVFRLEPGPTKDRAGMLLELGQACFNRLDKTQHGATARWLLGDIGQLPFIGTSSPSRWNFSAGGYLFFGSKFGEQGEIKGMVDCGALGYLGIAAHGHADALAVTLSICGEPCLIDSGTYSYWQDLRWRDYFRGTSAHNTVRVDHQDQSLSGGRFMWTRKATTKITRMPSAPDQFVFEGEHDGYMRLSDPLRHQRQVSFDAAHSTLTVRDSLFAAGPHVAEQFWHFAPSLDVSLTDGKLQVKGKNFRMSGEFSGAGLVIEMVRGADHPPLGWYSAAYEHKQPCDVLRISTTEIGQIIEAQFTIVIC